MSHGILTQQRNDNFVYLIMYIINACDNASFVCTNYSYSEALFARPIVINS